MSSLTTPTTLLSAVTATGASKAVQCDAGGPAFLQVNGITSATVALQGSIDGTNWSTIGYRRISDGVIMRPAAVYNAADPDDTLYWPIARPGGGPQQQASMFPGDGLTLDSGL